jgi:hypothetical protein
MSRTVFRKPTAFSKWVLVFAGLGFGLLLPGFVLGREFMAFFGCLGGVWIAFDFKGKTYRLPISTAVVVDHDALRALTPEQVIDDMIAKNPRPSGESSRSGVG